MRATKTGFNPRLTSAARRTAVSPAAGRSTEEFQSAPHFSSEANTNAEINQQRLLVSIRASLQQRGELLREFSMSTWINVSIRASLQQRGELTPATGRGAPQTFQSAPHFSSEANSVRFGIFVKRGMFQSAPHFSSEANSSSGRREDYGKRFQSAPHFSSEANFRFSIERKTRQGVSIRASLQQRGEQMTALEFIQLAKFQSAPHFSSEANFFLRRFYLNNPRFNPRLTSAARRTTVTRIFPVSLILFQSAPHFSSEANAASDGCEFVGTPGFNPRLTSAARRTRDLDERYT